MKLPLRWYWVGLLCVVLALGFWAWRRVPTSDSTGEANPVVQGEELEYSGPSWFPTRLHSWQFLLQSWALESGDDCKVLAEAVRQEQIVLHAYRQMEVLHFAKEADLDWLSYARAVESLAIRIFNAGGIAQFDFSRNVGDTKELFGAECELGGSQVMVMMETHANATVWGYDQDGNHVLLVNRGGLLNETNLDVVRGAYRVRFGEGAGMVLFEAHLAHEMKHCQQIRAQPIFYVPTLEDYQQNEIEAYIASIKIKQAGMVFYKCLF
ncbi:hypothetical protein [Meiothermus hypogaeus]|uniref:Uncharacterized protein n=2 Tax=Meiothermus hypogaeus TaxID=884155 RepID=A0A511R1B5_9DEIN|nr:hypothetical protein [Meiothermus hypogaeus]RIH76723.1 hypothetical protein Mhypo_02313 [Meiothermus hypogaeus]GEM83401.1 hypothetical protein MHY01S_15670 [Meiothermus hypogaeus NBRC 106114]